MKPEGGHILDLEFRRQTDEFTADIIRWMTSFVEKPNMKLNNWPPCPYAKKARLEQKIKFQYVPESEFFDAIDLICQNFPAEFEVAVMGTCPKDITPSDKDRFSTLIREKYQASDIWVLFDHPNEIETISGIKMNVGRYLLAIVQKKSSLDQARRKLAADGYYDSWSPNEVLWMTGMNLESLKEHSGK